jgi:hypothetical protein
MSKIPHQKSADSYFMELRSRRPRDEVDLIEATAKDVALRAGRKDLSGEDVLEAERDLMRRGQIADQG